MLSKFNFFVLNLLKKQNLNLLYSHIQSVRHSAHICTLNITIRYGRYVPPPQFAAGKEPTGLDNTEVWLIQIPPGVSKPAFHIATYYAILCRSWVILYFIVHCTWGGVFHTSTFQLDTKALNGKKFSLKNNKVISIDEVCHIFTLTLLFKINKGSNSYYTLWEYYTTVLYCI